METILKYRDITINRGTILYTNSIKLLLNEDVDFNNGLNVLNQIVLVERNPIRDYLAR